jgi:hypothetical protein
MNGKAQLLIFILAAAILATIITVAANQDTEMLEDDSEEKTSDGSPKFVTWVSFDNDEMRMVDTEKQISYTRNGKFDPETTWMLLNDVVEAFREARVPIHIAYGTLVGMERENQILRHDHDADCDVHCEDLAAVINVVAPLLAKKGIVMFRQFLMRTADQFYDDRSQSMLSFGRVNGNYVDIHFKSIAKQIVGHTYTDVGDRPYSGLMPVPVDREGWLDAVYTNYRSTVDRSYRYDSKKFEENMTRQPYKWTDYRKTYDLCKEFTDSKAETQELKTSDLDIKLIPALTVNGVRHEKHAYQHLQTEVVSPWFTLTPNMLIAVVRQRKGILRLLGIVKHRDRYTLTAMSTAVIRGDGKRFAVELEGDNICIRREGQVHRVGITADQQVEEWMYYAQ